MPSDSFRTVKFARLRYGVVWLGYAWMRAMVRLPFAWQLSLGKWLGGASLVCAPTRRRIAARNLQVCFPELAQDERADLLRRHFQALGASVVEMAMAWFGSAQEVRKRIRTEGEEHLRAALDKGCGVILFTAHFTTIEFFAPVLRQLCPRLCAMYKAPRNPFMNKIMNEGRGRNFDVLFAKDNVREMLRNLRRNAVVWYAADQSYDGKGTALLPFFNEPAMTNTAISRIAKASGATVLPYFCRRQPDDSSYVMSFGAPLQDLPSDNEEVDTRRLMLLIEDYIRTCPEQYWWIHRRFKGRPAPYPDLYGVAQQAT